MLIVPAHALIWDDDPDADLYGDPPDPFEVVDEVAIDRVVAGKARFLGLHLSDQHELFRRCVEQGWADGHIRYRFSIGNAAIKRLHAAMNPNRLPRSADREAAA